MDLYDETRRLWKHTQFLEDTIEAQKVEIDELNEKLEEVVDKFNKLLMFLSSKS